MNRIVAGVRPPDDIRTRLRWALGDALKARDADTVSALRSAMSAIGNAEAVEPGPGRPAGTGSAHFAGTVAGLGAGEAERRRLTEADVGPARWRRHGGSPRPIPRSGPGGSPWTS